MFGNKVLIDSHILVWLLYEPKKIRENSRKLIFDASEVYLSDGSLWELTIKYSTGKLPFSPELLIKGADDLNLLRLAIKDKHLTHYPNVKLIHEDPFDKLFLSQAESEGLFFLTSDNKILKNKSKNIIKN